MRRSEAPAADLSRCIARTASVAGVFRRPLASCYPALMRSGISLASIPIFLSASGCDDPEPTPTAPPEPSEATVAIDLNAISSQMFQPVVGWIVVLTGELRGRDFRLVDGKNTIGTAADCDVVLTDPYLSSRHAVIRPENGEFTMVDLDSTNGTYVNERRCSREDLIDNDKIRFGRTELKFKSLE